MHLPLSRGPFGSSITPISPLRSWIETPSKFLPAFHVDSFLMLMKSISSCDNGWNSIGMYPFLISAPFAAMASATSAMNVLIFPSYVSQVYHHCCVCKANVVSTLNPRSLSTIIITTISCDWGSPFWVIPMFSFGSRGYWEKSFTAGLLLGLSEFSEAENLVSVYAPISDVLPGWSKNVTVEPIHFSWKTKAIGAVCGYSCPPSGRIVRNFYLQWSHRLLAGCNEAAISPIKHGHQKAHFRKWRGWNF